MAKGAQKPRLDIAGPGAGKTHKMVDEIVAVLPSLPPYKHLAAITFTNAAANTIRERLDRRTQLRRTVFVGTTHSFVNRFILEPCATLFDKLPADRMFAAINVHEKGRGAAKYQGNLIKKGVVPYSAMIPIAQEILKDKVVRERIADRLGFLFVDEFQDTDIGMLDIIEQIRKARRTNVYVVGDPEQFVMGFTYQGRPIPAFDKLPFFRFRDVAEHHPLTENHRSNGEIVTFANRFRDDLQQSPVKPFRGKPCVLFIPSTALSEIIVAFRELSDHTPFEGTHRVRLYLSEENATFDSVSAQFGITRTSNVGRKTSTLLGDALELIAMALDRTQGKVCAEGQLTKLQWRQFGTNLLLKLRSGSFDFAAFTSFISDSFGHTISDSRKELLDESLSQLKSHMASGFAIAAPEQCASIRKAKGLEADAVLIVAKNATELKKWLITERAARVADKQDKCRLGYVAFTRPRELLVIACLKAIDGELESSFSDLGIHVVALKSDDLATEATPTPKAQDL